MTRGPVDKGRTVALWLALAVVLVALAFAAPINHDESQYLPAALLSRSGAPFVDFLYLQTPLQPYLTAPILAAFPGAGLTALRIATALLGVALLALVHASTRRAGASSGAALAAVVLLATTRTFLFSATVARNDLLPAALAGFAMLLLIDGAQASAKEGYRAAGAGLALGLASSAKISYLLPLAAVALFLTMEVRDRGSRRARVPALAAFSAGAVCGLLPTLAAWLRAPESFAYGVFEYGATAPMQWYRANGLGDRLGALAKLGDSLTVLALGAGLVAMVLVVADSLSRPHDPAGRRNRTMLDWMIVGGLVAALLPTPTWRQYFLPLLIPLFVRLSLVRWPGKPKRVALWLLLGLSAMVGAAPRVAALAGAAWSGRWPLIAAEREARWVGRTIAAEGKAGPVATLSPQAMIDSGVALDPRFATGPFAYRTADAIDDARQRRIRIVSPRTLFPELDRVPPAAILVGYEDGDNLDRIGLDRPLRRYALARGYRVFRSPFGRAELYFAPTGARIPRGD